MPRILVHAPSREDPDCRSLLAGQGHDVVVCKDRESLFASVAERRPDVLIYVLEDLVIDLGARAVGAGAARERRRVAAIVARVGVRQRSAASQDAERDR